MENNQSIYIPHVQKEYFARYCKFYKSDWTFDFKTHFDYYSVTFIIDGKFRVTKVKKQNNKFLKRTFTLGAGSVIIGNLEEIEEFDQLSEVGEFMSFSIMPIVFKNTNDENDIFRIFNHSEIKSIYNINEFSSNFCLECLNSIKYCLETDKGRFHTLLRIKNLVSQLDFELDALLGESKYVQENILVKTVNYIRENYTKNLTLDSVSEYLGISKSSINRICKKMENKTFNEFLTDERLKKAIYLLGNQNNNVKTVAILCGFNSYNAFYHAFVKKFGYPPSTNAAKNKNKYKRVNWPFENSNFDFYKEYE